jgi:hypothetical protein
MNTTPNPPATTKHSMTLEDATKRMIRVLTEKNLDFSAHDVTTLLREAVNMDALQLQGLPKSLQIQIGPIPKNTFEITHEEIKTLVHTAFESGRMPGYKRTATHSNRTGMTFWNYQKDGSSGNAPATLAALPN